MKFSQMIAELPPARPPVQIFDSDEVLSAEDYIDTDVIPPPDTDPIQGVDLDDETTMVINYTEALRLLWEVEETLKECLARARIGKAVKGTLFKNLDQSTQDITLFLQHITDEED